MSSSGSSDVSNAIFAVPSTYSGPVSLMTLNTSPSDASSTSVKEKVPQSTTTDAKTSSFGTKIDEEHANYVLMYDMLMGIRIAVSRNQAKDRKRLADLDFKASHKLAFDM